MKDLIRINDGSEVERISPLPVKETKTDRKFQKRKPRRHPKAEKVAELKAMPYDQYLQSEHWRHVRKLALNNADNACQICNDSESTLEVHHRTYERLGSEYIADLTVLCHSCHERFHDKLPKAAKSGPALLSNVANEKLAQALEKEYAIKAQLAAAEAERKFWEQALS